MTRRRTRKPKSETAPAAVPPLITIKKETTDGPEKASSPTLIRATPLPSTAQVEVVKSKQKARGSKTVKALHAKIDLDILEISNAVGSIRIRELSVMSVQEAQVSIDHFLDDKTKVEYMSKKENKLRLWQALCIEFRLVQTTSDDATSPSSAGLAVIKEELESEQVVLPSSASSTTIAVDTLPPLPTSFTQAKILLKSKAHVNIVDYLQERKAPAPKNTSPGQPRDMTHLLFPSASALRRYTIEKKRYARSKQVKDAFLAPLLKEMSFGRRR